jgi:hypothetical protein
MVSCFGGLDTRANGAKGDQIMQELRIIAQLALWAFVVLC